jgi:hypothetical protein
VFIRNLLSVIKIGKDEMDNQSAHFHKITYFPQQGTSKICSQETSSEIRFDVLRVVKVQALIFCVYTLCNMEILTNQTQKINISLFQTADIKEKWKKTT